MSRSPQHKSASELRRLDRTDELYRELADESDPNRRAALLEDVIVLNLPVARSIASRYRNRGCALEDLEQTASMALIRAARDFDPERGYHFLSYAVPCISGAVKKYFRDFGWTVRPPRPVQELQRRLEVAGQVVDPTTGTGPTVAELARSLDVAEHQVDEALAARGCFTPTSLDLEIGVGDSAVLGDLLVATDESALDAVDVRAVLRPAIARLTDADRDVLTMRFIEERTQQEMADELGTTQPAVSRIINRILREMRRTMSESSLTSTSAA